jgi:hypothetical protein
MTAVHHIYAQDRDRFWLLQITITRTPGLGQNSLSVICNLRKKAPQISGAFSSFLAFRWRIGLRTWANAGAGGTVHATLHRAGTAHSVRFSNGPRA